MLERNIDINIKIVQSTQIEDSGRFAHASIL